MLRMPLGPNGPTFRIRGLPIGRESGLRRPWEAPGPGRDSDRDSDSEPELSSSQGE